MLTQQCITAQAHARHPSSSAGVILLVMNQKFTGACIGIMVGGMFIAGALAYPHLPLLMASHWDVSGKINGSTPRPWGAFGLPLLVLVLWGVWALLPRIDPIAKGFPGFRFVYDFFWILITAVLAYIYALTLGANLGVVAHLPEKIIPAAAGVIVVMGLLLPWIKRNWFIGIRTPWTLSSDHVWDKTHRVASPLFVLAGLATLLALFDPIKSVTLAFIFGPIVLAALASTGYSYALYTREQRRS